ncbi:MAG: hypothetical protein KAR07_04095 [Spirochaetes bacterium]|nr:hypothetical protein [Spirochaetota bacterium]
MKTYQNILLVLIIFCSSLCFGADDAELSLAAQKIWKSFQHADQGLAGLLLEIDKINDLSQEHYGSKLVKGYRNISGVKAVIDNFSSFKDQIKQVNTNNNELIVICNKFISACDGNIAALKDFTKLVDTEDIAERREYKDIVKRLKIGKNEYVLGLNGFSDFLVKNNHLFRMATQFAYVLDNKSAILQFASKTKIEDYIMQVEKYLEKHEYGDAVRASLQAIRHDSENIDAKFFLAYSMYLSSKERRSLAEGAFRQIIKNNPEYYRAHLGLGMVYVDKFLDGKDAVLKSKAIDAINTGISGAENKQELIVVMALRKLDYFNSGSTSERGL